MKIIFAGTPDNAADTLRFLTSNGFEVVAVLTRVDAPIGRKRILTPSAVAVVAEELGLPIIKANSVGDAELDAIRTSGAELGVVVAYGSILNKRSLQALSAGWINLHYSLLPQLRGAAPVQHAILNGLNHTGVSVFQLDEGMDTGPIWGSAPLQIEPNDGYQSLLHKLTLLGCSLLSDVLPRIFSRTAHPQAQEGLPSFAPKLSRSNAQLAFDVDAKLLARKVRALNPEPTTWCLWRGEPMQILEAVALPQFDESAGEFGVVEKVRDQIIVRCHNSGLSLIRVKPAGKPEMFAKDWFRGITAPQDRMLS